MQDVLTVGLLALRLGVQEARIRSLCKRGEIPFHLAGRLRLISGADVPKAREACVKAGFLPAEQPEVAHAG